MFGSILGFYRGRLIEWRYLRFDKIQDGGWRPSWIYKNGNNFATALPIDMMFGSSMRFSGSADLTVQLSVTLSDKKAVLSQRWPRDAPYIWVPWILGTPWLRPRLLFPTFSWSFVPIDPMNVPTKFEVRIALPVPEIIGGTHKIWAVPGYAHAPFSLKF